MLFLLKVFCNVKFQQFQETKRSVVYYDENNAAGDDNNSAYDRGTSSGFDNLDDGAFVKQDEDDANEDYWDKR